MKPLTTILIYCTEINNFDIVNYCKNAMAIINTNKYW